MLMFIFLAAHSRFKIKLNQKPEKKTLFEVLFSRCSYLLKYRRIFVGPPSKFNLHATETLTSRIFVRLHYLIQLLI